MLSHQVAAYLVAYEARDEATMDRIFAWFLAAGYLTIANTLIANGLI